MDRRNEVVAYIALFLSIIALTLAALLSLNYHEHTCEEDELVLGNGQCAHIDTVLDQWEETHEGLHTRENSTHQDSDQDERGEPTPTATVQPEGSDGSSGERTTNSIHNGRGGDAKNTYNTDSTSNSLEGQDTRITYYHDSFIGRPYACEEYGHYDPTDITVAAVSVSQYACGTRLEVCSEHGCIVVVVKDRCECGGVDLSEAGWRKLGGVDWASVRVMQ